MVKETDQDHIADIPQPSSNIQAAHPPPQLPNMDQSLNLSSQNILNLIKSSSPNTTSSSDHRRLSTVDAITYIDVLGDIPSLEVGPDSADSSEGLPLSLHEPLPVFDPTLFVKQENPSLGLYPEDDSAISISNPELIDLPEIESNKLSSRTKASLRSTLRYLARLERYFVNKSLSEGLIETQEPLLLQISTHQFPLNFQDSIIQLSDFLGKTSSNFASEKDIYSFLEDELDISDSLAKYLVAAARIMDSDHLPKEFFPNSAQLKNIDLTTTSPKTFQGDLIMFEKAVKQAERNIFAKYNGENMKQHLTEHFQSQTLDRDIRGMIRRISEFLRKTHTDSSEEEKSSLFIHQYSMSFKHSSLLLLALKYYETNVKKKSVSRVLQYRATQNAFRQVYSTGHTMRRTMKKRREQLEQNNTTETTETTEAGNISQQKGRKAYKRKASSITATWSPAHFNSLTQINSSEPNISSTNQFPKTQANSISKTSYPLIGNSANITLISKTGIPALVPETLVSMSTSDQLSAAAHVSFVPVKKKAALVYEDEIDTLFTPVADEEHSSINNVVYATSHHIGDSGPLGPLMRILNDAIGIHYFFRFCETQYSSENIKFWLAVEKFKKLPHPSSERFLAAWDIFVKFIDPDTAQMEINIEGSSRDRIIEHLNKSSALLENISSQIFDSRPTREIPLPIVQKPIPTPSSDAELKNIHNPIFDRSGSGLIRESRRFSVPSISSGNPIDSTSVGVDDFVIIDTTTRDSVPQNGASINFYNQPISSPEFGQNPIQNLLESPKGRRKRGASFVGRMISKTNVPLPIDTSKQNHNVGENSNQNTGIFSTMFNIKSNLPSTPRLSLRTSRTDSTASSSSIHPSLPRPNPRGSPSPTNSPKKEPPSIASSLIPCIALVDWTPRHPNFLELSHGDIVFALPPTRQHASSDNKSSGTSNHSPLHSNPLASIGSATTSLVSTNRISSFSSIGSISTSSSSSIAESPRRSHSPSPINKKSQLFGKKKKNADEDIDQVCCIIDKYLHLPTSFSSICSLLDPTHRKRNSEELPRSNFSMQTLQVSPSTTWITGFSRGYYGKFPLSLVSPIIISSELTLDSLTIPPHQVQPLNDITPPHIPKNPPPPLPYSTPKSHKDIDPVIMKLASEPLVNEMWDQSQFSIYNLMDRDSLPRFLKSKWYKVMVEHLKLAYKTTICSEARTRKAKDHILGALRSGFDFKQTRFLKPAVKALNELQLQFEKAPLDSYLPGAYIMLYPE